MPPAWGSWLLLCRGIRALVGDPQTAGECQRTGGWVSVGRLEGCPFRGSGTMVGGCWSGAPLSRPGRCLVPPAQPRALHTAPGLGAARTPQGAECPRNPLSPVFVFGVPLINGSGAQVLEGPKEQPTRSLLYPRTPGSPSRGLSLLFPRHGARESRLPHAVSGVSPLSSKSPQATRGCHLPKHWGIPPVPHFSHQWGPHGAPAPLSPQRWGAPLSPRSRRSPKHCGVPSVAHGAEDPDSPWDPPRAPRCPPPPPARAATPPAPPIASRPVSHTPGGCRGVTQQRADVTALSWRPGGRQSCTGRRSRSTPSACTRGEPSPSPPAAEVPPRPASAMAWCEGAGTGLWGGAGVRRGPGGSAGGLRAAGPGGFGVSGVQKGPARGAGVPGEHRL